MVEHHETDGEAAQAVQLGAVPDGGSRREGGGTVTPDAGAHHWNPPSRSRAATSSCIDSA